MAERRRGRGVDGRVGVAAREGPGARYAGDGGEEERGAAAAAAAEEHSGRITAGAARGSLAGLAWRTRGDEEKSSWPREASAEEDEGNGPLLLAVAGLADMTSLSLSRAAPLRSLWAARWAGTGFMGLV